MTKHCIMHENPTDPKQPFFGVERNVIGTDGKSVYGLNGKLLKEKVPMVDGILKDSTQQSLYYSISHPESELYL